VATFRRPGRGGIALADGSHALARPGLIRAAMRRPGISTTGANFAILGGSALAGVASARALGPDGRGQLAIVMLWTALIYMLGNVGLPSSCCYHVALWPTHRPALAQWFRHVAVRQAVGMSVVSAAALWWFHLHMHLPTLLIGEYCTWAAAANFALYAACYAQGKGDFARFNLIRIVPSVAPGFLILAEVTLGRPSTAEVGAAYMLPTWITAAVAYLWLRDRNCGGPAPMLSDRRRRAILSYGWRSLASFSSLTLNRNADQAVLALLVPVGSLGIYSVAASASSPLASLAASLGMVGLPTITAMTGRSKGTSTWKILFRAALFIFLVAPMLALVLPWAIPLLYGRQFASAVMPAELLLLGGAFAALASVTDDLLRAHGHPGFVSITQGLGGLVTLVGTLLLGGRPLGAVAIASSLGFFVAFVLALARLCVATRALTGPGRHRRSSQSPEPSMVDA